MNNIKKNALIYAIFFIIFLVNSYIFQITTDEIWSYGFSYNISQGLLPYRDFNMVVGPLYSIIFSIPMYLFGNYYIVFTIANCLFQALIFTIIYNKIGKKSLYLLILFVLCPTSNNYNNFCALLTILILILESNNYKYKTVLTGIIIGSILMTKHNIGIFLMIPYLYNNRKELLKCITCLLIPVLLITTYLIVNNILLEYIDLCYLGASNFISNLKVDYFYMVLYILFIIPLIKYKELRNNGTFLYVLGFQIVIFPLFDFGHISIALLPIAYYYLSNDIKWYKYVIIIIIILTFTITTPNLLNRNSKISLSDNFFKYSYIQNNIIKYLDNYKEYLDNFDSDYYLFLDNAYLIKLYQNKTPNALDLINKGNHGQNERRYLDKLDENCKNKKCYFILDHKFFEKNKTSQLNQIFKDYVIEKSTYLKTIPSGDKLYIKNPED